MAELNRAVAGLDLSLTATGMARVVSGESGPEIRTWTVKSVGKRADTLEQRNTRIRRIVDDVEAFCRGASLVVVEGPSMMSKGGSNWDRAWLWGAVVDRLLLAGRLVAVAPPTVVKKFAAGKGNADKASVAVGVSRLWDQADCANDNEWDALALATMGGQRIGLVGMPTRAHHAAILESVSWPEPGDLTVRDAA